MDELANLVEAAILESARAFESEVPDGASGWFALYLCVTEGIDQRGAEKRRMVWVVRTDLDDFRPNRNEQDEVPRGALSCGLCPAARTSMTSALRSRDARRLFHCTRCSAD